MSDIFFLVRERLATKVRSSSAGKGAHYSVGCWHQTHKNPLVNPYPNRLDAEKNQVEMSFRSKESSTTKKTTLLDFTTGQKVDCKVKKIETFGLFVEIEGTRVSGLCHKSEVRLLPSLSAPK